MNNIKDIILTLIEMLENNYCGENMLPELFSGWCEDGDVFDNEKTKKIYNRIKDKADALLYEINSIILEEED